MSSQHPTLASLEDNFRDILGKAIRGLGIPVPGVEMSPDKTPDDRVLSAAASVLNLDPKALLDIAHERYFPSPGPIPETLRVFTTPFQEVVVNAYLLWDAGSRMAAVFDTGTDCQGIYDAVRELNLNLSHIFVTHAHGDHIFDLDRLVEKSGAEAWTSEPIDGVKTFEPGANFQIGGIQIETRRTWGHSANGVTYVIKGMERPIAIVGDALFAGSMGGGMVSYSAALATTQSEILSLPGETLVCPGHGPLTSVALERRHNPFFAGRIKS